MKPLRMKSLVISLASLALAGCAGVDLEKLETEFGLAVGPVAKLEAPSWPAYQAALSAQAPLLEKFSSACNPETPDMDRTVRIRCLELQARAGWWLAGLAGDDPGRGAGAASDVLRAADTARPLCREEPGFAACKALEAYAASAPTRALAHRLEAGMSGLRELTPDEGLELLRNYTDLAAARWPEEAGAELKELIGHDACYVSAASLRLRSPQLSDEMNLSIRDAAVAASAEAARGLGLSLCAADNPSCAEMAACGSGADSAVCRSRRAAALEFACGPGGLGRVSGM